MLRNMILGLMLGAVFSVVSFSAKADSTSILMEKLLEKGILTEDEYNQIKSELFEAAAKEAKANAAKPKKKKKAGVSMNFKSQLEAKMKDKKYGKRSIKFQGRVQGDYRDVDTAGVTDVFDIRRARFGAKFKFDEFFGEYQLDSFSEGAEDEGNVTDVAYVGMKMKNGMSWGIGKHKAPFSLEEQTSSRFIDFVERSFGNKIGGMGKNPGVFLKGNFADKKGTWMVSHMSQSTDDASSDKLNVGRVTYNLGSGDNVTHLGLGYGTAQSTGSTKKANWKGTSLISAVTMTTDMTDYDLTTLGLEGAYTFGSTKLQFEQMTQSYDGNADGTSMTAGVFDKDIVASYYTVMHMLSGQSYAKSYKKGKFNNLNPGSGDIWEIGFRYDIFDATDFKSGNGPTLSAATEATAKTFGLKWIPHNNIRFMATYTIADTDAEVNSTMGTSQKIVFFRGQAYF